MPTRIFVFWVAPTAVSVALAWHGFTFAPQ
jgi:hypothetical protein